MWMDFNKTAPKCGPYIHQKSSHIRSLTKALFYMELVKSWGGHVAITLPDEYYLLYLDNYFVLEYFHLWIKLIKSVASVTENCYMQNTSTPLGVRWTASPGQL